MTSADDMAHCRYCSKWGPCPDHRAEHQEAATPTVASTSPSSLIVERLIEALRPFHEVGCWLFARPDVPDDQPLIDLHGINGARGVLTRGDFKAASLAYQELEAAFRDLLLRPEGREPEQKTEGKKGRTR
jgi:hypothetical protein